MSTKLDPRQARERMGQVVKLWNEFDPIGVIPIGAPEDEYWRYAADSLQFLESGRGNELGEYLRWAVIEFMGLTKDPADPSFDLFAKKLQHWYLSQWAHLDALSSRGDR